MFVLYLHLYYFHIHIFITYLSWLHCFCMFITLPFVYIYYIFFCMHCFVYEVTAIFSSTCICSIILCIHYIYYYVSFYYIWLYIYLLYSFSAYLLLCFVYYYMFSFTFFLLLRNLLITLVWLIKQKIDSSSQGFTIQIRMGRVVFISKYIKNFRISQNTIFTIVNFCKNSSKKSRWLAVADTCNSSSSWLTPFKTYIYRRNPLLTFPSP